jgi:hypothetical protein
MTFQSASETAACIRSIRFLLQWAGKVLRSVMVFILDRFFLLVGAAVCDPVEPLLGFFGARHSRVASFFKALRRAVRFPHALADPVNQRLPVAVKL